MEQEKRKLYTDKEFRRFHYQRTWLRQNNYDSLITTKTFKECNTLEEAAYLVAEQESNYKKARSYTRLKKAYEKAGIPLKEFKEKFKL